MSFRPPVFVSVPCRLGLKDPSTAPIGHCKGLESLRLHLGISQPLHHLTSFAHPTGPKDTTYFDSETTLWMYVPMTY
jgi:hypothetical protein